MSAYRSKPDIAKSTTQAYRQKSTDDPMGCVLLPLITVTAYFVLSAIVRVMYGSGSHLDQIICRGSLLLFIAVLLLGARDAYRESEAREAQRKEWARGCQTALLTIVSRMEGFGWWDDYYCRSRYASHSVTLGLNSDQKAVSADETTVHVEVSQRVYDLLKERDTVRIYYLRESPLTFLLEEEL